MQPPTLSEPAATAARTEDEETVTDADHADAGTGDPRHKSPGPARRFADPDRSEEGADQRSVPVDAGELLAVLDDEYARRILGAVADRPRPARELMDICDASRATVYRRLNRLEEVELVRSRTEIHPDGHHRKVFEATLRRATIALEGSDVTAEVTVDGDPAGADAGNGTGLAPADD